MSEEKYLTSTLNGEEQEEENANQALLETTNNANKRKREKRKRKITENTNNPASCRNTGKVLFYSTRYSKRRPSPFYPEFNSFYPMRPCMTGFWEYMDEERAPHPFGFSLLVIRLREGLQFLDDCLSSNVAFQIGLFIVVMLFLLFFALRLAFHSSYHSSHSFSTMVLSIFVIYLTNKLFSMKTTVSEEKGGENNEEEDAENIGDGTMGQLLKRSIQLRKIVIKRMNTSYDRLKSMIPENIYPIIPIILRFFCVVMCILSCSNLSNIEVAPYVCILLGVSVFLLTFYHASIQSLYTISATLATSMLTCTIFFQTTDGAAFTNFWFGYIGEHGKLVSEALLRSLHITSADLNNMYPDFFLLCFNPFYVALAAVIYQLGFHEILLGVASILGVYFCCCSTIVMATAICANFFEYPAYFLWLSPLLSVADDHQLFNVIVISCSCLTLPLAFMFAERYGIRQPYFQAFMPLNTLLAIVAAQCVFPTRKKIPFKLDNSLIRKKQTGNFFQTILLSTLNSVKILITYAASYILSHAMDYFILFTKTTFETLLEKANLGTQIADTILYYLSLPLFYILGFKDYEMPFVSNVISRNVFVFKTQVVDELMHSVALRWLSECWVKFSWLSVDYDDRGVIFRSNQEDVTYFYVEGNILSPRSEVLVMHLLMNNVTIGSLFTVCAILCILLPHRVISIRSMMVSAYFTMIFTLMLVNLHLRLTASQHTGFACVNERGEPMCAEIIKELPDIFKFNGSMKINRNSLEFLCTTVTRKYSTFSSQKTVMY